MNRIKIINQVWLELLWCPEEAPYRCFYEQMLWKYAANSQENTHVKKQFATLLKLHFDMGVLL